MYTREQFANELLQALEQNFTPQEVSRWAYQVYLDRVREFEPGLEAVVMELVAIDEGPQFEYTIEELYQLVYQLSPQSSDEQTQLNSKNMTLDIEQLAGLLNHLYQEGQAEQETNPFHATVWYAQCLNVIRQIGNNEDFVSAVLFNLGKSLAYLNKTEQAVACLEASANIQQRQGKGESEIDCIYTAGSVIALLEDYESAQRLLRKALKGYQSLGQREKIVQCEQELGEVEKHYKSISRIKPLPKPHEFIIHVENNVVDKFTVTPAGEVHWQDGKYDHSTPIGLSVPWQVVCINR